MDVCVHLFLGGDTDMKKRITYSRRERRTAKNRRGFYQLENYLNAAKRASLLLMDSEIGIEKLEKSLTERQRLYAKACVFKGIEEEKSAAAQN